VTGVAIDHATDKVYVANIEDTSVSLIDGNTSNSSNTNGRSRSPTNAAVGDYPGSTAFDPAVETAYAQDIRHPRRRTSRASTMTRPYLAR
jgi:DNA-binding beta-propeller fold protein YncE